MTTYHIATTFVIRSHFEYTENSSCGLSAGNHNEVCTHHWLVVEREPLHGPQRIGGAWHIFEHNESLTYHFQCFRRNDVNDVSELREYREEGLLQFCNERRQLEDPVQ